MSFGEVDKQNTRGPMHESPITIWTVSMTEANTTKKNNSTLDSKIQGIRILENEMSLSRSQMKLQSMAEKIRQRFSLKQLRQQLQEINEQVHLHSLQNQIVISDESLEYKLT